MFPISNYLLFVAAALALLLIPGPAVLYIITRSIVQGRAAGLVSMMGLELGNLLQVIAAAIGLTVVLSTSAVAFVIVKYLGAAYLIYLGIRKILVRDETRELHTRENVRLSKIFSQGVIVNVLNPKVSLFFLTFLPQFVDSSRSNVTAQILVLGLTFVFLGVITDSMYALAAGTAGKWLKHSRTYLRMERYFAGGIYIALGIGTAVSGTGKAS